jgi:hypothetical protein
MCGTLARSANRHVTFFDAAEFGTEQLRSGQVRSGQVRWLAGLCQRCRECIEKEVQSEEIPRVNSFQKFEELAKKEWPEALFCRVKRVIGNPLQSAKQSDFAPTVPEDDRKMERGIARLFADRFPELRELEQDENDWETHRVPHIIQSTAVPRKAGGNLIKERYIFRQVLENKEGETASEKAYRHLRALVREAERLGRGQLAVVRLEGTNELLQQKMLECLTAHSGLQIELCVPSYASRLGGKEAPSTAGTTKEGKQWRYPRPRRPRTETLVVKAKENNADIEEVIRQMKSKVDIAKVDVQVKSLVGGRNGKIAIKLAPARGTAAPKLRKAILEAMGNTVNAEVVSNRKLTVRDLDQTITEQEIREAVNAAVGSPDRSTEAIQVSGLKKPQGGTLHLSDTDADKLLERGKVRTGWNQCRVQEIVGPVKCFQCLQFGHIASRCAAERKLAAGTCFRCGKEGHLSYVCKVYGHRGDRATCPEYRKAIEATSESRRPRKASA